MVKEWFVSLVGAGLVMLASTVCGTAKAVPLPKLRPAKVVEETKFPPLALFDGWSSQEVADARAKCAVLLKGLTLTYEPLQPLGKSGGCGTAAPIRIFAIGSSRIVPPADTNCEFAEALHGWITSSLQPAARDYLHMDVTVINNASAYVCRLRNGLTTGKLSEHGKANALDIAIVEFSDGSKTSIEGDWQGTAPLLGPTAKSDFLRRLRRDACIRFTTVLGPGTDQYHGDHFHVDLARRRNGYRICK